MSTTVRRGRSAGLGIRLGVLAAMTALAIVAVIGCSDSPTGPPTPPTDDSTLLIDKLLVSVVPGGSETIVVSAAAADGSPLAVTLENDAPGIVTAALADSVITVTGLDLGTAHLTITSASGRTRALPVQVYSQFVADLGEMYLTYVDTFAFSFFCAYDPIVPAGYHAVGSMFGPHIPMPPYVVVDGAYAVPVIKPKPGSDAVRFTHQFAGVGYPYAVAWTPVAPAGYVAIGTFEIDGYNGYSPPDSALCIREDLTTTAAVGTLLQVLNMSSPAEYQLRFYAIDAPDAGPHAGAHLTAGAFINTIGNIAPPSDHAAAHLLNVELPALEEAADQDFTPKLTSYNAPPEYTAPKMARAVLVPCTILSDPQYAQNLSWKMAHSPFYRLERQVVYKRIYHNRNNTSALQTNSVLIRSGITTTESERVWSETQISVTAELGLSIKALSGKISATVSRTLGYETQTSISELNEKEVTTSVNTPPFKSVAAWQEISRFVLYRHNGTELEPVSSWETGIDSYVTDEYPD